MRIKGKLKSWNDDRGFGFIDPIQGGEEVFVHIKAFRPGDGRPQLNELLWFELELGPQGKKRAKKVEFVRRMPANSKMHSESSTERGAGSLWAIPGFVFLYIVVSILWAPPLFVGAFYIAVSAATYLAYKRDKSAAQRGAWRTAESTLHFGRLLEAGLVGCLLSSICGTRPSNLSFVLFSGVWSSLTSLASSSSVRSLHQ